jgi:hypothetical protein
LFCRLKIGGWNLLFISLATFCWLFCFPFNFVSAFQKATVSRDAHSAIFTLCWLTRSPNEKILKEDNNNNNNNKKGEKKSHWKIKKVDEGGGGTRRRIFIFQNEPRLEQLAVIACNLAFS